MSATTSTTTRSGGLSNSRWAPTRSSSAPGSGRTPYAAPPSQIPQTSNSTADPAAPPQSALLAGGGQTPSPASAAATAARDDARRAAAELSRFERIVRRMNWKLPFLDQAYRKATATVTAGGDQHSASASAGAAEAAAEAQLMFKLDFFEYYMLLERALVHLQLVFGVVISRDHHHHHRLGQGNNSSSSSNNTSKAAGGGGANGGSGVGGGPGQLSDHRYHANVLSALDSTDNPLHDTLGAPEVRRQLGKAKDLRNRWKNADAHADDNANANGGVASRAGAGAGAGAGAAAAPLQSYDLRNILAVIFAAFDRAFGVAQGYVARLNGVAEAAEAAAAAGAMVVDSAPFAAPGGGVGRVLRATNGAMHASESSSFDEEEQWEFMVEAMDWEAV